MSNRLKTYPLLDTINHPNDLRRLDVQQLPQVCSELRDCLLENVARTGGHLASGLGVVELTVAIHYVFNTPDDNLIWDVGHQAYPHKMLTERRQQMHTMKQLNGLSGFPKRDESPYDDFGVGHSSTSISAALGMAIADQLNGQTRSHIAVIGDGAMTAGMAFEGLHHAASLSADILVILNDNDMSISPNVGGFSSYLSKVLTSDLYQDMRKRSKQVLKHLPPFEGLAKFAEDRMKDFAGFSNLFEDFGFDYFGPEDGHNVIELVRKLQQLKCRRGPKLLHIKTVKGKGYEKAEAAPIDYHGVSHFDIAQGLPANKKEEKPTFTQVFSQWLVETARRDNKLIGITPAMREGSGLVAFSEQFPQRYFDVAIAEQHAVTLAAGMACKETKPVVAIYSTFLQRAYDQLIHDVALQNLNVLFAVDRAGIVGEDGATHAGIFDLAYCRLIPNMVIMTPSDEFEMIEMLNTGYAHAGPAMVRYPKGTGSKGTTPKNNAKTMPIGKARVVRQGRQLAILAFGTLLSRLQAVAEATNATLVDMRFVKPLDVGLLEQLCVSHHYFVTVEEGCLLGGVGEQVGQLVHTFNTTAKIKCLGITDEFVAHGKRDEILAQYGLDEEQLTADISEFYDPDNLSIKIL
ncbi:MAG: 1-deoxy-D-xylulose-5-phosphate synthase [Gammaproteobacteria bacterium]|nr:MAG: 1-deoxy-D-xylulose-5-phosphate synthase [Gammaproteobacteria bacterium]